MSEKGLFLWEKKKKRKQNNPKSYASYYEERSKKICYLWQLSVGNVILQFQTPSHCIITINKQPSTGTHSC